MIKKLSLGRVIWKYTLAFALILVIMLLPMIVKGEVFLYSGDGVSEHLPFMRYYSGWIRDAVSAIFHAERIPLYSHSLGYGSDILYALNWFGMGDPLNLLYGLLPPSQILVSYTLINIIRLYLAGLAVLLLIGHFGRFNRYSHLAGAVYAFSTFGFTLGLLRHPIFINPMIQLPLLAIGIDGVIQRKSAIPFILAVAWTALCGYYFLFMCSILVFIVAIVLHIDHYRGRALAALPGSLGRGLLYYLIGICLAGPVFFPACMSFILGGRTADILRMPALSAGVFRYLFTLPYKTMSSFSAGTCQPALLWLGCIAALCFTPRARIRDRVLAIIALLMIMLPVTDHLMNGFAYASTRWTFGIAALIACVGIAGLGRLTRLSGGQLRVVDAVSWVGIAYFAYAVAAILLNHRAHISLDVLESAAYPGFVAAGFLVSWVAIRCVHTARFREREHWKIRAGRVLSVVLLANIVAAGCLWEIPRVLTDTYRTPAQLQAIYDSSPLNDPLFHDEGAFVRVDCDTSATTHHNDGVTAGVSSTVFYNSTLPASVYRATGEMELPMFMCNHLSGLNGRAPLEALWSVTHFVRNTGEGRKCPVPYGFELVKRTGDTELYRNSLAVPFGRTASEYAPESDFRAASAARRQWLLMQAPVLPSEDEQLPAVEPEYSDQRVDCSIECAEGVEWTDRRLRAASGGSMTIRFDGLPDSETCLRLANIAYEKYDDSEIVWNIRGAEVDYDVSFSTPAHNQFENRPDIMISLGYSEGAQREITVTFHQAFEARLDDIEVICQPVGAFKSYIDRLRRAPLENVEFGTNAIRGTCEVDGPSILTLALPWSVGWTARVDGRPEKLFASGTALTALKLSPGPHVVELDYHTPGLCAGIIGLVVGLGALIALLLAARRTRHAR